MRIVLPAQKKLVFESTLQIRWGDMDAMGHLNNASYFRYLESVRIDWLHSLGAVPDPRGPDAPLINSLQQLLQARAAAASHLRDCALTHARVPIVQVGELELSTLDVICLCTGVAHGMEHLHRARPVPPPLPQLLRNYRTFCRTDR